MEIFNLKRRRRDNLRCWGPAVSLVDGVGR